MDGSIEMGQQCPVDVEWSNSVYRLSNLSVKIPWLTASLHSILFNQEYLESSLRYLHHKFVADVGGHRTENIKASMIAWSSVNRVRKQC